MAQIVKAIEIRKNKEKAKEEELGSDRGQDDAKQIFREQREGKTNYRA